MKYKITEMTTQEMKVEYEDGSWAKIASSPDQPKEYYLTMIARYHHSNDQEVAITDHPMKIGDEGVVGEGIPEEFVHQNDVTEKEVLKKRRATD